MIKQNSKRFISIILSLLLVVVALVVFFDFIQPEYQNIQALKGKLIGEQNFLASEAAAVQQAQEIISTYDNQSQGAANIGLAMPTGKDVAGAIAQIYGIAANNNINVTAVTVSAPTLEPKTTADGDAGNGGAGSLMGIVKPLASISFEVSGQGSYENFKNFLSQIETNIRIFDITNLKIDPVAGTSGAKPGNQDLFTYAITVATYYQVP